MPFFTGEPPRKEQFNAELWCCLLYQLKELLNKLPSSQWFQMPWCWYEVIVMCKNIASSPPLSTHSKHYVNCWLYLWSNTKKNTKILQNYPALLKHPEEYYQINHISHMKLLIILLLKSDYSGITWSMPSGIILRICSTNVRPRYNVTSSLIGGRIHKTIPVFWLQIPRLQAHFMGYTIWTTYYKTNLENILYSLQGRITWDQVIYSKATGNRATSHPKNKILMHSSVQNTLTKSKFINMNTHRFVQPFYNFVLCGFCKSLFM